MNDCSQDKMIFFSPTKNIGISIKVLYCKSNLVSHVLLPCQSEVSDFDDIIISNKAVSGS